MFGKNASFPCILSVHLLESFNRREVTIDNLEEGYRSSNLHLGKKIVELLKVGNIGCSKLSQYSTKCRVFQRIEKPGENVFEFSRLHLYRFEFVYKL